MTTLEDLDRRVTALELGLAQSAKTENALGRLDQKVDAMHRVIAESDARTGEKLADLQADLRATQQRLETRISEEVRGAERRMVDTLNERFDGVMAALDRFANPPK